MQADCSLLPPLSVDPCFQEVEDVFSTAIQCWHFAIALEYNAVCSDCDTELQDEVKSGLPSCICQCGLLSPNPVAVTIIWQESDFRIRATKLLRLHALNLVAFRLKASFDHATVMS